MNQFEIESPWVEGKLEVRFSFDDPVRVLAGERQGESGRVVALWKLDPEPNYIIEFPDGTSESVTEPELELLDAPEDRLRASLILKQIR